jgi:hypothetical protein
LVCLREGGWYVSPRPRQERGDKSAGASLLVLLVLGISISLGLNDLVLLVTVLATEAAMLKSGVGTAFTAQQQRRRFDIQKRWFYAKTRR